MGMTAPPLPSSSPFFPTTYTHHLFSLARRKPKKHWKENNQDNPDHFFSSKGSQLAGPLNKLLSTLP